MSEQPEKSGGGQLTDRLSDRLSDRLTDKAERELTSSANDDFLSHED